MSSASAQIDVKGIVQAVGFRYFCRVQAQSLNLNGWVKNNNDGSVSSFVEGEQGSIKQYFTLLHNKKQKNIIKSCDSDSRAKNVVDSQSQKKMRLLY